MNLCAAKHTHGSTALASTGESALVQISSCSSYVVKYLYYTDFMLVRMQTSLLHIMFFKALSARMNLRQIQNSF